MFNVSTILFRQLSHYYRSSSLRHRPPERNILLKPMPARVYRTTLLRRKKAEQRKEGSSTPRRTDAEKRDRVRERERRESRRSRRAKSLRLGEAAKARVVNSMLRANAKQWGEEEVVIHSGGCVNISVKSRRSLL